MALRSSEQLEQMLQRFKKSQEKQRRKPTKKPWKKARTAEEQAKRRKKYQRRYNRSKKGKTRYRRWQRSPQGKLSRKRAYREKIKQLNTLKAGGCCLCGQTDPRVLRFVRKKGEKLEFQPVIANWQRSIEAWRRASEKCRVICANCWLARKRRKTWKGGEAKTAREAPEKPQESAVNAPLGADLPVFDVGGAHSCGTCRSPLTKAGQKYCSPRCRLLAWAAQQILKLYRTGQAPGLQRIIAELAEVRR